MLTRDELLAVIQGFEDHCASLPPDETFRVSDVVEAADGVLAVRETDGEHTIYFDKTRFAMKPDTYFDDCSVRIAYLNRSPVGFFYSVNVGSHAGMIQAAKECLGPKNGGPGPQWHTTPVLVEYRRKPAPVLTLRIWWTNGADVAKLYNEHEGLTSLRLPHYITEQLRIRLVHTSRGQVYASTELGLIAFDETRKLPPELHGYAGIAIREEDAAAVWALAGKVTDLELKPAPILLPA